MAEAISITIEDKSLLEKIDNLAKEEFRNNRSATIEFYIKKGLENESRK